MGTFPIATVIKPSDLSGVTNGKLDSSLLRTISTNNHSLHQKAKRAWESLRQLALVIPNINLVSTGCYRTYDQQKTLFLQRYSTPYNSAIHTTADQRTWNGVTYFKLKTAEAAASPGNSNHGLGLAIDVAIYNPADPADPFSLNNKAINWLVANAAGHGYSWELQSEPWHLRYVAGDTLPQAVTQFERTGYPVSTAAFDPANKKWGDYPYISKPIIKLGSNNASVKYAKGFFKNYGGASTLYVDSYFDSNFLTLVKNFQTYFNFLSDGLTYTPTRPFITGNIGSQTWAWIDSLIANRQF